MDEPGGPQEPRRNRGVEIYDRPTGLAALGPRIVPVLILLILLAVAIFLLVRFVF